MSNHVEARSGRRSFLIFGCAVSLLASAAHGGDPTQIEFDLAGMGYGAAADGWLDPASPNYNAVEMAAESVRKDSESEVDVDCRMIRTLLEHRAAGGAYPRLGHPHPKEGLAPL